MNEDLFYAGIDGGGTKTLAVIVDALGHEHGRGIAAGANFTSTGIAETIANVRSAIVEASANAGGTPLHRAWIGLAGVDRPADFAAVLPRLQELAQEVRLTNDATLALSGLEDAVGVALIAGTGSIAVGCDAHGTTARAGGWGNILGDEGGGYAIGRAGLQAAVRAADGRGPWTDLLDRVLHALQFDSPAQLVGAVYANRDARMIAGMAPLVFAAARSGDATAEAIVRREAEELALAALTVGTKLALPTALPLALAGSLLTRDDGYRALVLDSIRRHRALGQVAIVDCPAAAAARSARQPFTAHGASSTSPPE